MMPKKQGKDFYSIQEDLSSSFYRICSGFYRSLLVLPLHRVLEELQNIPLLSASLMSCLNLVVASVYSSLIRSPFLNRKE